MLDIAQIRSIKNALTIALLIQRDFPEVAEEYEDMNRREIVEKKGLDKVYHVTESEAIVGLGYANRGLKKKLLGFEPFPGLIEDKDELRRLKEKHEKRSRKVVGRYLVKNKKGFHAWSNEDYRRHGRNRD